jgi:hypothetical protein
VAILWCLKLKTPFNYLKSLNIKNQTAEVGQSPSMSGTIARPSGKHGASTILTADASSSVIQAGTKNEAPPRVVCGLRRMDTSLSTQDRQIAQSLLADPAIPIAEIAKRLNVSKQTFYRHFPGGRSARGG